jgi:hypothetical protein
MFSIMVERDTDLQAARTLVEQTVQDLRSEISMNLIGEEEWTTLEGWTKTGENTYEITLGIHADAGGGSLDFGNRTFSVTLSPNFPPLDTTGLQTVEIDGEAHAFDLNGAEFTPEEANFLADYDWTSTSIHWQISRSCWLSTILA